MINEPYRPLYERIVEKVQNVLITNGSEISLKNTPENTGHVKKYKK